MGTHRNIGKIATCLQNDFAYAGTEISLETSVLEEAAAANDNGSLFIG